MASEELGSEQLAAVGDGEIEASPSGAAAVTPGVASSRRTDPMVRTLWSIILVIILLTLATVLYGLVTGVFGNGAPRTLNEQRLVTTSARIEAGSTDRYDWMAYVLALIDDGQYMKAQQEIDRGRKTLKDQEINADMDYMRAELYLAQGKLGEALKTADEALKTIRGTYDKDLAEFKEQGGRMSKAVAFGISDNYGELLLLKAEIYEQQEDWESALAVYDEYLKENKTAANIFTMRGAVKEKLGDNEGAETDFRQTLEFIPNDPQALAGLERIGAAE